MFNLDDGELQGITNLRQNKFITVCKLDKGNGVVLLNKSDYVKKMENILLDKSKFKNLNRSQITSLNN